MIFKDKAFFDKENKTVISIRDGVMEYYGHEIGKEPADKIFKVYRSPSTVAKVYKDIEGIPLTHNHIDTSKPVPSEEIKGIVDTSELINHYDRDNDSRLAVKNMITLEDLSAIKEDRELSLGYLGDLIEHSIYDFEQIDIIPHHLAIVDRGRCGTVCKFQDKGVQMKFHKSFCDEDGNLSLEQVIEIAKALPDAIKEIDVSEIGAVVAPLKEIVEKVNGEEPETKDEGKEKEKQTDEEKEKEELSDEEKEKEFEDRLSKAMQKHASVIDHARSFLADDYQFSQKSSKQIMIDAIATIHKGVSFADHELEVAFKMLKKPETNLANFGDSKPKDGFLDLAGKEL